MRLLAVSGLNRQLGMPDRALSSDSLRTGLVDHPGLIAILCSVMLGRLTTGLLLVSRRLARDPFR